ncbi:MAG: hypothetical protein GX786_01935 [Clostridiales bacterium]|nr:hypothetical protein [Clostridiales bacterium]
MLEISDYEEDTRSLILSLEEDMDPSVRVHAWVAVINGNSANKELALAYVEGMTDQYYDDYQKAFLFTDQNQPVANEEHEEFILQTEEKLIKYRKDLETAEARNIPEINEVIAQLEADLEDRDEYYWEINQQEMDLYQCALPYLYILPSGDYLDFHQQQELTELYDQYIQGSMGIDEFIKKSDEIIQRK